MKSIIDTKESRHREAKDNLIQYVTLLRNQHIIEDKTLSMFLNQINKIEDNPFQLLEDIIDSEIELTKNNRKYIASLQLKEIK